MVPGGVRVGTSALTSRSMKEEEMIKVAEFLDRAVQISLTLQKEAGSKLLKDFLRVATEGNGEGKQQLEALARDVEQFATSFPLPGIPVNSLSQHCVHCISVGSFTDFLSFTRFYRMQAPSRSLSLSHKLPKLVVRHKCPFPPLRKEVRRNKKHAVFTYSKGNGSFLCFLSLYSRASTSVLIY